MLELMKKKRLSVVLIASEDWIPGMNTFIPGTCPDPVILFRLLADKYDIDVEIIDPVLPKNLPILKRHTVYRGVDPIRALKILFLRRKVDLVVGVFESSLVVLSLLRRLMSFKPKLVMWDITPDEVWKPRKWLQNIAVPRLDRLLVLSKNQIPYLTRRWGVGERSIAIWQHVDTDFYQPEEFNSDGPILAIGDDHGRDWPTLIEALAPLDVDLVVKTKAKLVVPSGARMRLRQISERLSFQDLRKLYADASLVVIPLSETLNVSGVGSILESMAMGKPLVISDNPPIRDYLEPGRTADVVPVGDSVKLRQAVSTIMADPERMRTMGRLARRRAVDLYGSEAYAQRFAGALRSI
jgi:glycosyltransferase involved in cell wall biosynthesis